LRQSFSLVALFLVSSSIQGLSKSDFKKCKLEEEF